MPATMTATEALEEYLQGLSKDELQALTRATLGRVPGRSKEHSIEAIIEAMTGDKRRRNECCLALYLFLKNAGVPVHRAQYLEGLIKDIAESNDGDRLTT